MRRTQHFLKGSLNKQKADVIIQTIFIVSLTTFGAT